MKTIHILLVEDNFLHLKLIKKMLGTDSKKIVAVSTLKECIDHLNTNNFDVVLLDLNLPDSKGKDTFRDVHEYRKDLPIILITGSEDENFALELIREGAQDYITKQRLSPEILSRSIYYSIERQALLQDVIEQKERIQSIEQERTIIQQALIHSRENFYRSVAESPLGIRIVTDDGETIYANKAILDIYGFDNIEEFKRTSVKDRYTPESYKEYLQRRCCRKNGEIGSSSKYEISIVRKNGEIRHLLVYRKRVLWNDQMQYQVLYSDITKRKVAEQEVQEKNEMLHDIIADRNKFFSIIAHDLKGPLGTFVAITKILSDALQTMSPVEVKEIVENLKKSASNVYSLLENLLTWSQLKRDRIKFAPEMLHVKKQVKTSLDALHESVVRKEIAIFIPIPDDLKVFADQQMFHTIIRNLVSNAVKFTPRGGRIDVTARCCADHCIEICVRDSGVGIPAEIKNKLFHLPEKITRTGTDGEAGTGLGISLCKEFVEKHGGRIWVESEVGEGSSFFMTFPAPEK